MIIKPSFFENGGEVDIWAHFPILVKDAIVPEKGRLFYRRSKKGFYELVLISHLSKKETILKKGSLYDVVDEANHLMKLKQKTWEGDVVG